MDQRTRRLATLLILSLLLLAGCTQTKQAAAVPTTVPTAAPVATPEPTPTPTPEPTPTPTPEPRSVTTGRWYADGVPNPTYQPVMISIENAPGARPQIGLNAADIIYEAPVEYSITRFHLIFNDEYPLFAGPVRSSRVYWMRLQQEWNTMYIHRGYGGLPYSRDWVGIHVEPYLTGTGDMLWRMRGRKSVHSLMANIPELVDAFYPGNIAVPFKRFQFADRPDTTQGKPFEKVALNFFYRNQKEKNWVTFAYDPETNALSRYQDGKLFYTRMPAGGRSPGTARIARKEPFVCQNLIVQYVTFTEVGDEKDHRDARLNGQGKCDYFINGMHLTGYWSRLSYSDKTVYYLDNNEIVTLAPGRTWICLHPDDFAQSPVVITYRDGTTGEPATSRATLLPPVDDAETIAPEDMGYADE